MDLADIAVVMVRPRGSRNIGIAARAIANHGLGALVLVAPAAFDPDEARWNAPGAHDVVNGAIIVPTVADAVGASRLVVGTTARTRRLRWPVWTPGQLADAVRVGPGPASILFGPEHTGLSNDDLAWCHALLRLPTTEASSLNLAQAITVTAHALRDRVASTPSGPVAPPTSAPTAMVARIAEDATTVLGRSGYLAGRSAAQVRGTLFRMLARLGITHAEAAMLRGMLSQVRWALEHAGGGDEEPEGPRSDAG
ncbi:MAG: hypothetical protein D6798_14630 [Deltaproteobacteria bacterium]|nr:MAG: hypothetical protein D6798_14630 [Deltaproteobacteria bacterium]